MALTKIVSGGQTGVDRGGARCSACGGILMIMSKMRH
jgi:hypothetical protein